MSNSSSCSSGPSDVTLLTILFVGLKLTGHIYWSWWWVLSPLWIATSIALIAVVVAIIAHNRSKKRLNEFFSPGSGK